MTKPDVRDACLERCAQDGDPPCWQVDHDAGQAFIPCPDCLAEAGIEPTPPPPDPNAVIRRLL